MSDLRAGSPAGRVRGGRTDPHGGARRAIGLRSLACGHGAERTAPVRPVPASPCPRVALFPERVPRSVLRRFVPLGSGLLVVLSFHAEASGAEPLSPREPDPVFGPEWIPADDPILGDLRALSLRGEVPLGLVGLLPLTRSELARRLALGPRVASTLAPGAPAASPSRSALERELAGELAAIGHPSEWTEVRPAFEQPTPAGRIRIRPYVWAEGTWADGHAPDWGDRPRVGISATAHLSSRWALHQDLFAGDVEEGRRFGDALVNHTDLLLHLESAYAGYRFDSGYARLGRTRHGWGPARFGHLLLDPSVPPVDHFEYGLDLGRFRFRSLAGVLSVGTEKNVALHRLEWCPDPRWVVGVSEGAIYHGSPGQVLYLLGWVPYTIVERVQGQDAYRSGDLADVRNNVLYQGDLLFRFGSSSAAWIELLLDDVATESSDQPTRLGAVLGLETAPRWGESDGRLGLELVKIYDFTYSVYYEDSDWTHQGRSLGHPLGPDVEAGRVFAGWRPGPDWDLGMEVSLTRKGEGELGRPWYPEGDPRSGSNPGSGASELTGVVERRIGVDLRAVFAPSAAWRIAGRLGIGRTENRRHLVGRDRGDATFDLSLRWHR